jgi:hypothetical protein
MKRPNVVSDLHIRQALEARARGGIRPDIDLWPRLEHAVAGQRQAGARYPRRQRALRHTALALLVCMGSLAGGVAGAGAASPHLRHFLLQAIGLAPEGPAAAMDASGRPVEIHPLPPFTLYYPQIQPAGLTYHVIAQLIPLGQGVEIEGSVGMGPPMSCTAAAAQCPNPIRGLYSTLTDGRLGSPGLLVPFSNRSTRVVWFGFAGVDQSFLQIAEWDAAASPVKDLSGASIPPAASLLTVKKGGTTIAIETNLGPAEAQNVADSLESLQLP